VQSPYQPGDDPYYSQTDKSQRFTPVGFCQQVNYSPHHQRDAPQEIALAPLRHIAGDLDGDKGVDLVDLGFFADYWLLNNVNGWPDFNGDNKVDFVDFAMLAANWQQSIPFP